MDVSKQRSYAQRTSRRVWVPCRDCREYRKLTPAQKKVSQKLALVIETLDSGTLRTVRAPARGPSEVPGNRVDYCERQGARRSPHRQGSGAATSSRGVGRDRSAAASGAPLPARGQPRHAPHLAAPYWLATQRHNSFVVNAKQRALRASKRQGAATQRKQRTRKTHATREQGSAKMAGGNKTSSRSGLGQRESIGNPLNLTLGRQTRLRRFYP